MSLRCIIHPGVLCAKALGLKNVLKIILDVFIRVERINHREFEEVLKELDSEYGNVLYLTAVRTHYDEGFFVNCCRVFGNSF